MQNRTYLTTEAPYASGCGGRDGTDGTGGITTPFYPLDIQKLLVHFTVH